MSSKINKNIKQNTSIVIPENYVGLVYYKDKYLFTLNSGDYKLDKSTFERVFNKNERKNRKAKKQLYNFNLHFIKSEPINFSMQFKAYTLKQKLNLTLNCNYTIFNPEKFAQELLTTWYKTTDKRTLSYINSWFKDFANFVIKKHLTKNLSQDMLLKISNKYFKKYGIKINSICLNNTNSSFFDTEIKTEKETNQIKEITQPNISDNVQFCPNCQAKLITGALHCVRCGMHIKNNNNLQSQSIDKW